MFDNFLLTAAPRDIREWSHADPACFQVRTAEHRLDLRQHHAVLRAGAKAGTATLTSMIYGLTPSYSLTDHPDHQTNEVAVEALSSCLPVRCTFRRRRCILPVTSFEVNPPGMHGGRSKIASRQGYILGLAGIWEHWEDYDGSKLESFAILHCHPGASLRSRFSRLPACVPEADLLGWISASSAEEAAKLLRPMAAADIAIAEEGCLVDTMQL